MVLVLGHEQFIGDQLRKLCEWSGSHSARNDSVWLSLCSEGVCWLKAVVEEVKP